MKKVILIISILLFGISAQAQPEFMDEEKKAKLQAFKRTFISEHLALSTEDSVKFWPVYDEYEKEMQAVRKELMGLRKGLTAKSDEQLKKDLEKGLNLKEKELAIERAYVSKFEKVITIRQIAALYDAEHKFKRKLLQKLGERRKVRMERF